MAFGIGLGKALTTRRIAPALGIACALAFGGSASGDAFVDKANAAAAATPGTKPAHDILMPALAKMADFPDTAAWKHGEILGLLFAEPGDAVWTQLEPWATAEPQQAALKALESITTGKDRYILGFPYGKDAVPAEWVDAKLYVELNKDNLLYSATYPYLDKLSDLVGLAMFEGARSASGGDGDRALALCMQTIQLGRILMERGSFLESEAGLLFMKLGFERLRDLMYQYESAFNADKLREAAKTLTQLRIREIPLPVINRIAADQIVARTFEEKGSVDGAYLAQLMSGAKTQDRPLTRLSEAAFWASRASDQADWFDTTDKVKGVWADWEKRWKLPDLYDPLFDIPSDFKRMDAEKYLAVYFPMLGIDQLFDARKRLLVEVAGTINSMGVVGFRIKQKTLPPMLASVEPKFVEQLEPDFFAIDKRQLRRTYLPFTFWVPIRDQKFDRREEPHPYKISVAMIRGAASLSSLDGGLAKSVLVAVAPGFLGAWLDTAPAGVIDGSQLTVDATRLREHMQSMADDHKWTTEQRNALTALFERYADVGVTPENFDEKYDAWFSATGESTRAWADSLGIEVSLLTDTVKEAARTLLGIERIRNAMASAEAGDTIDADTAEQILKTYLDVAIQQPILDKLLLLAKAEKDRAMAAIEAAGGFGKPTTVFDAEIDDTQFLLYSVGPNGIDDRARLVGPGGIDILMWPPILSLQRNAAKSQN